METNYSGSITAISAMAVVILSKLFPNLNVSTQDIVTIIGGLTVIGGVVKQMIDHRNLGIASGIPRQ